MKTKSSPSFRARSFSILLAATLATEVAQAEPTPLRATQPAAPVAPAPSPAMPADAPAKPAEAMASGKVLETMDVPGYTYARVETTTGERWVAGPLTALRVGDTIAWPDGTEMKNFPSKTLGRTFESIVFTDRLVVGGATSKDAGSPKPHAALSAKADGPAISGVAKAEGGVTVAEIYDRRAELAGKEVVMRGKVVKFNAGVMGRNWIHLRDGSETSAGENDITVTGDGSAAVGDTVLVRGNVVLNKDFGFNYRYDVMIENAKVVVE